VVYFRRFYLVFFDALVKLVDKANIGCKIGASCTAIYLYADDIILLAPSVHVLQSLVNICESELKFLDMTINAQKSSCMRFGPKHKNVCANVVALGSTINWETLSRYLGVYLESSVKFKCSFSINKARFYKAFNNIFGKIERNASQEVLFALIKSKCLPILIICTQLFPLSERVVSLFGTARAGRRFRIDTEVR